VSRPNITERLRENYRPVRKLGGLLAAYPALRFVVRSALAAFLAGFFPSIGRSISF
jgi:hypothetical protein